MAASPLYQIAWHFPGRTVPLSQQRIGLAIVDYLFRSGIPADLAAHAPGDVQQMGGNAGAVAHLGVSLGLPATAGWR